MILHTKLIIHEHVYEALDYIVLPDWSHHPVHQTPFAVGIKHKTNVET